MRLRVDLYDGYDITITRGMETFIESIPELGGDRVAIITDDVVDSIYPDVFANSFKGKTVFKYVVPHGEQNKNTTQYIRLLNELCRDKFTRSDTIVTFGGGVIGDLGGFVASTYMRGIRLIAVPTTLLAQVDSSVGGKTAIDLDGGKNLCGTFYQPAAVYINVDFLKTLPEREILCGKGEIAKYKLLEPDLEFDVDDIEQCIYDCLTVKKNIVTEDEKEGGVRKLLNLGHTFGHAIEKYCDYSLSHGECVGIGLRYTLDISAKICGLSPKDHNDLNAILDRYGCPQKANYPVNDLLELMLMDKKRQSDGISMVLIYADLKPQIIKLTLTQIEECLK